MSWRSVGMVLARPVAAHFGPAPTGTPQVAVTLVEIESGLVLPVLYLFFTAAAVKVTLRWLALLGWVGRDPRTLNQPGALSRPVLANVGNRPDGKGGQRLAVTWILPAPGGAEEVDPGVLAAALAAIDSVASGVRRPPPAPAAPTAAPVRQPPAAPPAPPAERRALPAPPAAAPPPARSSAPAGAPPAAAPERRAPKQAPAGALNKWLKVISAATKPADVRALVGQVPAELMSPVWLRLVALEVAAAGGAIG